MEFRLDADCFQNKIRLEYDHFIVMKIENVINFRRKIKEMKINSSDEIEQNKDFLLNFLNTNSKISETLIWQDNNVVKEETMKMDEKILEQLENKDGNLNESSDDKKDELINDKDGSNFEKQDASFEGEKKNDDKSDEKNDDSGKIDEKNPNKPDDKKQFPWMKVIGGILGCVAVGGVVVLYKRDILSNRDTKDNIVNSNNTEEDNIV